MAIELPVPERLIAAVGAISGQITCATQAWYVAYRSQLNYAK
jgi:hypothetical protein